MTPNGPASGETRERIWDAFMGRKPAETRQSGDWHTSNTLNRPNPAGQSGCENLLRAAALGKGLPKAIAELQMSEGPSPHSLAKCRDMVGRTALILAAARGDLDSVHQCLDAHPVPQEAVNDSDKHELSALEYASWRGHPKVVDYLLRMGANPNTHDVFGLQPLHKAVGHGHTQVVMRLLSDGAVNPNARCADVRAPPEYMAQTRHQTPLHIACAREQFGHPSVADEKMVRLLLRYGSNPNVQDDTGNTPLHMAAERGDLPVARMLLRAGANFNVLNTKGLRPVDLLPTSSSDTLYDMLVTGDTS